jgi:hypothetical protein
MKIEVTHPGALIQLPDKYDFSGTSSIKIDNNNLVVEVFNYSGWMIGPAIVIASFPLHHMEQYVYCVYVICADTVGWITIDRRHKNVKYIDPSLGTINQ